MRIRLSRTSFPRALRRLGNRKIETLTLATIAVLSAIGIARQDGPGATVASITSNAVAKATSIATPVVASVAVRPSAPLGAVSAAKDLAMISHPRVDSWIKRFTTSQRSSMMVYLDRMPKYEEMISAELAERDMPQSLIYLAMVESGFNPKARSPVKASGLWQFMSATARQFGLTVNRRIDERNNPLRATEAALSYLSDLHDRFGSWYLAAAAYNSGEGRVSKALKRVTGRTKGTDADFYRISSRLPRETREYVPKIIAAARIGQNPGRYGFSAD
ncbi:MAG TPA: lytic transglycosylase domain-containing protein [Gemmatimonadaceae bacterium]|nr:lytic transglycosylase domain-containing protein [Gemmatimonadaceae bacterium]